ncbi:MAG: iron-containing alcohol dehydrogenase [Pirellulaceae bacterium]|nr:iron-containing alcohol dehydrogenase [Pirellulaceae bacterium]
MKNSVWQFSTASNIRFGRGCSALLADELQRYGVVRPLIVTDHTIVNLPAVAELLQTLQRAGMVCSVFESCLPEPPIAIAEAAILLGRDFNADGVVGIGGGSNLDIAKIAATVLRHGGSPSDYFGFDTIPGPVLPLFALPTTAGTGSEVSHSAVLTDPVSQVKVSTLSRWLRPTVAIIDPALTDSCPSVVTAHSGIDALVHAIEAVTNRDFTEMVDVDPQARAYEGSYPLTGIIAGEAIRLIGRFLVRAYIFPNDTEARDGMAEAAMLAGMAFSNSGVAVVHALEYPIGVLTHCSHGEGNGLLLPHVMRFNLPNCTASMANIAQWLGCDTSRLSSHSAANAAIDAVVSLQHAIGIRTRLRDLGLTTEQIPLVAERAFHIKRLMDVNPRRPTEADLVTILQNAF